MPYAVMQTMPEPPTLEQLKIAFRGVPGLTEVDASTLGKDAYGVVVRGFELEAATALKGTLAAQGVETEVVDEATLPQLPESRQVHRADCTPEGLVIYDPMDRSFTLGWQNVWVIAAGMVRMSDFARVEVRDRPIYTGRYSPPVAFRRETKEEQSDHALLEIIITRAALRYTMKMDKLDCMSFQYLGPRRTQNWAENFSLMVRDMIQFAPMAAVNRGAFSIREQGAQPYSLFYPSKGAFYEEITWILWQMLRTSDGTANEIKP
jgi:hypothetical protein